MKYFIDTEFLEGTQEQSKVIKFLEYALFVFLTPLMIILIHVSFWLLIPMSILYAIGCYYIEKIIKTKPTIDLISIGIVCEDGREYYAISKEFNLKEAWNRYQWKHRRVSDTNAIKEKKYWIREKVLKPIYLELKEIDSCTNKSEFKPYFDKHLIKEMILQYWKISTDKQKYIELKKLINKYGKTNKQIAEEIKDFVSQKKLLNTPADDFATHELKSTYEGRMQVVKHCFGSPEFYGYYADCDWVVFCWLFDKMIDLPTGFPMYCIDLKQELDRKANNKVIFLTKEEGIKRLKQDIDYPKQTNEHNALDDARWNKKLYEFLSSL